MLGGLRASKSLTRGILGRYWSGVSQRAKYSHITVDCSPMFLEGSTENVEAIKSEMNNEILNAFKTNGYFYAKNVESFDKPYIARCYDYLKELHSLPKEEKIKYVKPHGTYSGLDVGEKYAELDYEQGSVSSVRSWDYTKEFTYEQYGLNYPETEYLSEGFSEFMSSMYERQNEFGIKLLKSLEESLHVETGFFTQNFQKGDLGTVRLLHYPGGEEEETKSDMGISAHTDFEMFTLMHQDSKGLQFLRYDEQNMCWGKDWIDAPVSEYFVVTVGDCLERFTNGFLKALPHRVIKTAEPRNSIIRFNSIAPEALVSPLERFGEPKYTPVTVKEHMKTTLDNLEKGLGSWDVENHRSKTAHYRY